MQRRAASSTGLSTRVVRIAIVIIRTNVDYQPSFRCNPRMLQCIYIADAHIGRSKPPIALRIKWHLSRFVGAIQI